MILLDKFGIAIEKNINKIFKFIKAEKNLLETFIKFAQVFKIKSEILDKEAERLQK